MARAGRRGDRRRPARCRARQGRSGLLAQPHQGPDTVGKRRDQWPCTARAKLPSESRRRDPAGRARTGRCRPDAREHSARYPLRGRRPDRHQQAGRHGGPPGPGQPDRHAGQRPALPLRRQPCRASAASSAPASCTGSTRTPPASWSPPRPSAPTTTSRPSSPITAAPGRCTAPISPLPGAAPSRPSGTVDAPLGRDAEQPAEAGRAQGWPRSHHPLRRRSALRRRRLGHHPHPAANSKPAAPTRSACTWPISAIRWSPTRSMPPALRPRPTACPTPPRPAVAGARPPGPARRRTRLRAPGDRRGNVLRGPAAAPICRHCRMRSKPYDLAFAR